MKSATPRILTINGGSSSIKFALFEAGDSLRRILEGGIDRIGLPEATLAVKGSDKADNFSRVVTAPNHTAAVGALMDWIEERIGGVALTAVGHRVVHGGPKYSEPQRITAEMVVELHRLSPFDPEHLPEEILLIEAFQIRFRNLVKELETSLRQKYPAVETRLLLEPFAALADDHDFWNHTLDGLAVLGGPSLFRVFRLQRPVAALAVVADSFHTKPLRRFLQSVGRYQVLGLSLQKIQLFEGNRDALDEIDPAPGVPRTITEALGDELTEPLSTVSSHGGVGQASTPMHHGHGGRKDETDIDAERFFRVVDRAVLEHHSRPSGLPLFLAALPEHHHRFHQVSHNPFLMAEGLTINPDDLSIDELQERAWQVVEPQYQARLATLVDEFAVAKSKGLGSDDLAQVAQAAAAGRVATLLIEADRQLDGQLDGATGRVEVAKLSHPQVDDLLDDLGELVEKMGGRVLVIPAERMPGRTGLAATYRH